MFTKSNASRKQELSINLEKRKFMGKVGKYATVGVGGMAILMTPTLSSANNYMKVMGNNGWGNGNQAAPGKSLYHNRAENTKEPGTPANNDKHGVSDPQ